MEIPAYFLSKEKTPMKRRTLLLSLVALLVLGAVGASRAERDKTLVTFDFQNATAGSGGGLGDLIVLASSREFPIKSAVFSWTNPNGIFGGFTDHGVQTWNWDFPGDNVYVGRGTGPFSTCPTSCGTRFVITLTAYSAWVLTEFSVQSQVNDVPYSVDILAAQGDSLTLLGTITVHAGLPAMQSLSGLNQSFAAGPAQILISPQEFSPTGSGYLAVDDVKIKGTEEWR
jgi:hypothetical protein